MCGVGATLVVADLHLEHVGGPLFVVVIGAGQGLELPVGEVARAGGDGERNVGRGDFPGDVAAVINIPIGNG